MKVRKSYLKLKKNLCPFEKAGSTTFCKTSEKTGKIKECDKEAGDEKEEELAEEEVILIHYEQRKVMLSQLHPIDVPDAEPPSDLRQVQKQVKKKTKEVVSTFNFVLWHSRCSRQWPAANRSSSWIGMTTGP